ncbi:MAG: RNA methyltransferase [Ekhidna sp.]
MLTKKEQKFIKSLKVKKYRTREKRFLVEGAKNVLELLKSDYEVDMIVGSDQFLEKSPKLEGIRYEQVKTQLLDELGTFKSNDAALAVVKMKKPNPIFTDGVEYIFALDGVGDPGNLGTIIRTLDWFGFNQLVCSDDCAEFYHPKVIASTMGSFTRVNVVHTDLENFLLNSKMSVFGADMIGRNVFQDPLDEPAIILMGSESNGIRDSIQRYVSQSISIPRFGAAESLNVGIATGILAAHLRMER